MRRSVAAEPTRAVVGDEVHRHDITGWSSPVSVWNGGSWTWSWSLLTGEQPEEWPQVELVLSVRPFFYPSGGQEAALQTVRADVVATVWRSTERVVDRRPTVLSMYSETLRSSDLAKVGDVAQRLLGSVVAAAEDLAEVIPRHLGAEPHSRDPVGDFNEAMQAERAGE